MFPDEQRPESELRDQFRKLQLSDPEGLVTKYEGLIGRHKKLQEQLDQKTGIASKTQQAEWNKERQDLLRKLGEAHGALKIYREGYWKLTDEIRELRKSKSMRLGRALTSPYNRLRALGKAKLDESSSSPVQENAGDQDATLGLSSASARTTSDISSEPVVKRPSPDPKSITTSEKKSITAPQYNQEFDSTIPISERTLEQLKAEFEDVPNIQRLKRVLNREWYSFGNVDEPAVYLRQFPDLVAELSHKDKQFANQILGAQRVRKIGFNLPPRSRGAAYVVEPDRVMYCVHSTPVFNSNGYSVRTRGVAQAIHSSNREVVVVARPGYPWDVKTDIPGPELERHQASLDGITYVHVPGENLNTAPLDHYIHAAVDGFVREARLMRPQLIQAASNHITALPALIAARKLGIPFVYEVRGFWELTGKTTNPHWGTSERYELAVELEALVANNADQVIAITEQVADELVARGVDAGKIQIAPNAVDPQTILPLPLDVKYAAERKVRTDVPVIGFAGSVVPYEGLETLIEASHALADRGIDHQVVIAGTGSEVEALKSLRNHLKIKTVTFLGRVPNVEIPRLLSTFDIMPCPRLSEEVTELVSPLKPLEAFSALKAVVLSDVAPHKVMAGTGQERALIFESGNAEDLTNKLQQLIHDEKLQKQLGRAGRLWTLSERNWRALGKRFARAYERAQTQHKDQQPAQNRSRTTIKLGVIADEFTTSTLSGACQVVPLGRDSWRQQFDEENFDAIFVESAWSGNMGQWHRGVGYYTPEESTDLFELLRAARSKSIPTIFWNKEDPVHFDRFVKTASEFDHIFTTDANMISRYLVHASEHTVSVSSLPFYAEPKIHNPLQSSRSYEHSVAYAGTFYGERYKTRSRQLERLLITSEPYGLTIYDRQLQFDKSPYQFPEQFKPYVEGALPYVEVLHQYKSHLAQLNVNSVTDSPTMYSRRVVEIAASGGIVLSGPGRGIEESLGENILSSNDHAVWNSALYDWKNNPESKLRESWRQMRTIFRSHTTSTALSIVFRTAGIPVDGLTLEDYAVRLAEPSDNTVQSLVNQSVRPTFVFGTGISDSQTEILEQSGVKVTAGVQDTDVEATWIGDVTGPVDRTHFEDLLSATFYGTW